MATINPTWSQLRRTYCVAKTWFEQRAISVSLAPIWRGGIDGSPSDFSPIDLCLSRQAFCRFFVESWLASRPHVRVTSNDTNEFAIGDELIFSVQDGRFSTGEIPYSPSLAPSRITGLCRTAHRVFEEQFVVRVNTRCHGAHAKVFASTKFVHTMARRDRPYIIGCVKQLLAHVNPDALRLFRRLGVPSANALIWLTEGDATASARRRQIAQQYPLLFAYLIDQNNDAKHEYITQVIDCGESLIDGLSKIGYSHAVVRRLRGLTTQRCAKRLDNLRAAMGVVEAAMPLPPERYPVSQRDWQVLVALSRIAGREHLARLATTLPEQRMGDNVNVTEASVTGVRDMLTDFERAVAGQWRLTSHAISPLLNKRFETLLAMSERWHREVARQSVNADANGEVRYCWPGLLIDGSFTTDTHVIVELTNDMQLVEEGAQQGHCVASYAHQCLSGGSRIVSVRRPNGTIVSTAELRREGDGIVCVQHQARRNSAPPSDAAASMRQLLRAIAGNRIVVNCDWPQLGRVQQGVIDMLPWWANEPDVPASIRAALRERLALRTAGGPAPEQWAADLDLLVAA